MITVPTLTVTHEQSDLDTDDVERGVIPPTQIPVRDTGKRLAPKNTIENAEAGHRSQVEDTWDDYPEVSVHN